MTTARQLFKSACDGRGKRLHLKTQKSARNSSPN